MSTILQVDCPKCNCTFSLNLDISLCVKQEVIYRTRLEMAEENAKPQEERQWLVVCYNASEDMFEVVKRKSV